MKTTKNEKPRGIIHLTGFFEEPNDQQDFDLLIDENSILKQNALNEIFNIPTSVRDELLKQNKLRGELARLIKLNYLNNFNVEYFDWVATEIEGMYKNSYLGQAINLNKSKD